MSGEKKIRKLWKIPVYVILAALITAASYVAYVFLTFSRIEDNLVLEPAGSSNAVASAGEKYRIVTYNIGFGAYTADYTFFMDDEYRQEIINEALEEKH